MKFTEFNILQEMFKSNVQENYQMSCEMGGNCPIESYYHESLCRSCHFKKCIQKGMRTDLVNIEENKTHPFNVVGLSERLSFAFYCYIVVLCATMFS